MRRRRIFGLCVKWAGGTTMRMTPTDQWPRRAQRGRRCMWSGGAWYHQINKWIGSRASGSRSRARHTFERANAPSWRPAQLPGPQVQQSKKYRKAVKKKDTPSHRIIAYRVASHRSLIDHHHRSIECLIPHTYSYSMYKPGRLTASCSVSVSA